MNQDLSNMSGSTYAIQITNLSMAFQGRLVLDRIDLRIPSFRSLCLCGVNGVGKSTLLRIIAGLLSPTRGMVRINGLEMKDNPQTTRSQIGVISHKSMLYSDLTVVENLSFFARLYGVKNHRRRIEGLLSDAGLLAFGHDKTAVLSRGMLQRLAIARAMVGAPDIVLADEPFTGLDIQAGRHLVDVLQKFTHDGGTIVMTTHEMNFALSCCNRVVVLDDARLIFDANIEEIDRDSFARDYLSYARQHS